MRYVSGGMRGYPRFNFDKFYECEEWLAGIGVPSHNPARVDVEDFGFDPDRSIEEQSFDLDLAMARDILFIASDECDGVVVLPEWELSTGARWEVGVAQLIGKPVDAWVPYAGGKDGYVLEAVTRSKVISLVTKASS